MAMAPIDYLGPDGGRLAMAFGGGAIAAWALLLSIGSFVWKLVGRTRLDRIGELERALVEERAACRQMEVRLVSRIQQLETLLIAHGSGPLRQAMQAAISEIRIEGEKP